MDTPQLPSHRPTSGPKLPSHRPGSKAEEKVAKKTDDLLNFVPSVPSTRPKKKETSTTSSDSVTEPVDVDSTVVENLGPSNSVKSVESSDESTADQTKEAIEPTRSAQEDEVPVVPATRPHKSVEIPSVPSKRPVRKTQPNSELDTEPKESPDESTKDSETKETQSEDSETKEKQSEDSETKEKQSEDSETTTPQTEDSETTTPQTEELETEETETEEPETEETENATVKNAVEEPASSQDTSSVEPETIGKPVTESKSVNIPDPSSKEDTDLPEITPVTTHKSSYGSVLDLYGKASPEKLRTEAQETPKKPFEEPITEPETASSQPSESRKEPPAVPKKKPTPRVPKKPSSKIAAFQQMLQQQQQADLGLIQSRTPSIPTHRPRKEKSVDSQVSQESQESTSSAGSTRMPVFGLPGMALPGMFSAQTATQSKDVPVQDHRRGRAKGPRGRKLPGEVKKSVDTSDLDKKFTTFVTDVWSFGSEVTQKVDRAVSEEAEEVNSVANAVVEESELTVKDLQSTEQAEPASDEAPTEAITYKSTVPAIEVLEPRESNESFEDAVDQKIIDKTSTSDSASEPEKPTASLSLTEEPKAESEPVSTTTEAEVLTEPVDDLADDSKIGPTTMETQATPE